MVDIACDSGVAVPTQTNHAVAAELSQQFSCHCVVCLFIYSVLGLYSVTRQLPSHILYNLGRAFAPSFIHKSLSEGKQTAFRPIHMSLLTYEHSFLLVNTLFCTLNIHNRYITINKLI